MECPQIYHADPGVRRDSASVCLIQALNQTLIQTLIQRVAQRLVQRLLATDRQPPNSYRSRHTAQRESQREER